MDIEQHNKTFDHVLVRYGELSTKGKNKKDFINRLVQNVKMTFRDIAELKYEKTRDRLYILLNGADESVVMERLKAVFGISSFSLAMKVDSEIDDIRRVAFDVAKVATASTFKVETKRNYKQFRYTSDEINRMVASDILQSLDLKVDVKTPELRIKIEVRQFDTYIMSDKIKGAGGYPVGVGGRALLMLSGGIDSPVAGYLAMKRGVSIDCIHFASPPYTSSKAQQKVTDIARKISGFQGCIRVHTIPFTELQMEIYKHCDEAYAITIMRRMMYRIAEKVARKNACLAIVNGESLGQVASQTLESIGVINEVVSMPVIRPAVAMDKLEIIDIANRIHTYDISIRPFEDCCTIFTPKNPVTRPKLEKAQYMETLFDFKALVDECVKNSVINDVFIENHSNSNLF